MAKSSRGTSAGSEIYLDSVIPPTTYYVDKTIVKNQRYFYYATALNDINESIPSNEVSIVSYYTEDNATGKSAPLPPENLAAKERDGYFNLSWDTPNFDGGSSIKEYRIYRGTSAGNEIYLDSVMPSTTYYVDKTFVNNQRYFYYVTAVNDINESISSNEVSFVPYYTENKEDSFLKQALSNVLFYLGIGFILIVIVVFSYSRIRKRDIFNNEIRMNVYKYITNHPGEHRDRIKKKLIMADGTLSHHLRQLHRVGKIQIEKDGRYKYYYPTGSTNLRPFTPIQKEIVDILMRKSSTTQEVADILGKERQTIHYHLKNLVDKGTLESEKADRKIYWYVKSNE